MPITLKEWLDSPARQELIQARQTDQATRQARVIKAAEDAQLALNHPGWQRLADHVGALLQDATAKVEESKRRLVSEAMPAQEAEVLRFAAARWVGRQEMLREVLAYLPSLVADKLDTDATTV